MGEFTIKDIAEKCGVGVSTVSRAINNHPDISKGTRDKIMQTIAEYHYTPNNNAQNLKRTASKTIAILVKALDNPFFSSMIRVFEKEINQERYSFFLQHVDEKEDEVEVALRLVKEKHPKGLVFLGGYFSHSEEKLRQITVPFVLSTVGQLNSAEESICSFLSVDDKKESYKMTEYLIGLGHRKIAILAAFEEDESIGKLRLEGYKEALLEHGIGVAPELICYTDEDYQCYSLEAGYRSMEKLLASGEEFTAVFALSDMSAIGACKAIFKSGKKVPQDISVAGFDGLDQGFYYEPSITTISQPLEEIAKESIDTLFTMIHKKKKVQPEIFEGTLLKRESTRRLDNVKK